MLTKGVRGKFADIDVWRFEIKQRCRPLNDRPSKAPPTSSTRRQYISKMGLVNSVRGWGRGMDGKHFLKILDFFWEKDESVLLKVRLLKMIQ